MAVGQIIGLVEEMPADQIGVVRVTAQNSLSMMENLPQKGLADGVNIYQVDRTPNSSRQFGDKRHFLCGCKPATSVHRQIQIASWAPEAGRQRTEQNGNQTTNSLLCANGGENRLLEV